MAIYEFRETGMLLLKDTAFAEEGIRERSDLQRVLREQIEIISPDTMVIAEEFSDWEDSRRRIDLFGLDMDANLVVIELKRTETGGHMELQAIRYASMISTMTFQQVVRAHERYLQSMGRTDANAEELILGFLGWPEPNEDEFAKDVRIVLASAEFSKEITSSVMWLNERGLDIQCVRLRPYKLDDRIVVDVQQIIPLPEAAGYQVLIREKSEQQRVARQTSRDYTKYDLRIGDAVHTRLSKRALIYRVVQEAIKRGVTAEEVANAVTWRRIWASVDGEYKEPQFIEVAKSLSGPGRLHNSQRFFTADDELFHLNRRTYALTNQWGRRTLEAVDKIIEAIHASDISYVPSAG